MIKNNSNTKVRRHEAVRTKINACGKEFKLVVRRSNKYMYAQIVNLFTGKTVAGTRGKDVEKIGLDIANKAKEHKITDVVFERGSLRYHGEVKLIAESARKGGLKF